MMRSLIPLAILCCSLNVTAAEWLDHSVDSDFDHLTSLYHFLHQHPELAFREKETASRIAQEFQEIGLEVMKGIGKTGVIAFLRNGEGPLMMMRAPIDALPIEEKSGLSFSSSVRGVGYDNATQVWISHACGHDSDATALVGAARQLNAIKDLWRGTVVFVAQPADEIGEGAKAMVNDGLIDRIGHPDYMIGYHNLPQFESGTIAWVPFDKAAIAGINLVDITVYGEPGHSIWPHKAKDPVVLAAQIVINLQALISRETDPMDSAQITVGAINGGATHTSIPAEVQLRLSVRAVESATQERINESIKRLAEHQALAYGMPEDRLPVVTVQPGTMAFKNDEYLSKLAVSGISEMIGESNVERDQPSLAGEEFATYRTDSPESKLFYFWVGSTDPKVLAASEAGEIKAPALHTPVYAPDADVSIKTAVKALVGIALKALEK